jgi:uncharacterized repeat protein (TIGR03803 family)
LFLLWAAVASQAQTFTVLHSFDGTDGSALEVAPLVQATNGYLFGTTEAGGANTEGTVFAITTGGTVTTVTSFTGNDGAEPFSGVVQSAAGGLYGTTNFGGSDGLGTVFKINAQTLTCCTALLKPMEVRRKVELFRARTETSMALPSIRERTALARCSKSRRAAHSPCCTIFTRNGGEGGNPYAPLMQASNEKFYRTTWDGGSFDHGTIFEISSTGTFATLYQFCLHNPNTCPDGYNVEGALVEGSDGNLYGMTARGGDISCSLNGYVGCGTVFSITTAGALTTLHNFEGTTAQAQYQH